MSVLNEQTTTGVVRLGDKELLVVAQKHAYLRRYLDYNDFQAILSRQYSENAYKLLCILIPAMDPKRPKAVAEGTAIQEWEFDGFPSEELWQRYKNGDEDAYDEDRDPGPTTDEIAIAFETALKVNGAGRVGKIINLVQGATKIIELDEGRQEQALSRTLPGSSGESGSTNSGMNHRTTTVI